MEPCDKRLVKPKSYPRRWCLCARFVVAFFGFGFGLNTRPVSGFCRLGLGAGPTFFAPVLRVWCLTVPAFFLVVLFLTDFFVTVASRHRFGSALGGSTTHHLRRAPRAPA